MSLLYQEPQYRNNTKAAESTNTGPFDLRYGESSELPALTGELTSESGELLESKLAEGCSARGSGALLGFADVIVELHRAGSLRSDFHRRRLSAQSRQAATPAKLAYEWNPTTEEFAAVADSEGANFRDNWKTVRNLLEARPQAATHAELRAGWPAADPQPSKGVLYDWLNRAHAEKLVRREGTGRRNDPYRYRLPNADDAYYDRGELPPIRGRF